MDKAKSEQQARQNEWAVLARQGDEEAFVQLVQEIMPMIKRKAASFQGCGVEFDDLVQEGAVALLRAVSRYEADRDVPFAAFAILCAERQMITVMRAHSRQQDPDHAPVSLEGLGKEVPSKTSDNPEERLLMQERLRTVFNEADTKLSPLEKKVLVAYLDSVSYGTTAARLGLSPKTVDNAMQRIRRKLRKAESAH